MTADLTPVQIFLDADYLVKSVIVLLIAASVFSWSIMIARRVEIGIERRKLRSVTKILTEIGTLDELRELTDEGDGRVHRILRAMASEWHWSIRNAGFDYNRVRQRLGSAVEQAISTQYRALTGRSPWLATIGSAAPFVGLFGTVWGIMNSFIAISQTQDTSLAVVAPGMAEALFATAVGLFCAIPASVGYNRLTQGITAIDQEWRSIASQIEIAISRSYGTTRSYGNIK